MCDVNDKSYWTCHRCIKICHQPCIDTWLNVQTKCPHCSYIPITKRLAWLHAKRILYEGLSSYLVVTGVQRIWMVVNGNFEHHGFILLFFEGYLILSIFTILYFSWRLGGPICAIFDCWNAFVACWNAFVAVLWHIPETIFQCAVHYLKTIVWVWNTVMIETMAFLIYGLVIGARHCIRLMSR